VARLSPGMPVKVTMSSVADPGASAAGTAPPAAAAAPAAASSPAVDK
jgi:hypothetical protein